MQWYIGYVALLVFDFALVVSFWLLIRYEKYRFKRTIQREKTKISIINELISIMNKTTSRNQLSKKYPNLYIYLMQSTSIINKGFNLDNVEVSIFKSISDEPVKGLDKVAFQKEYYSAPNDIIKLVSSCSDTLGKIFKLSHPLKYSMLMVKKNITLRILSILVDIAMKMSKKANQRIIEDSQNKTLDYRFIGDATDVLYA